jgi:flagellar FliJ protein
MISSHRQLGSANPQNPSHALVRPALSNRLAESRHPVRNALGALVRQKQFQNDTARRQVDQIEAMIADLDRMVSAMESEIRAEEDRTGLHDPAHFAYSTYAKATIARRDNLKRTVDRLTGMLNDAKAALAAALNGAEEADSTAAPRVVSDQVETSASAIRRITAGRLKH